MSAGGFVLTSACGAALVALLVSEVLARRQRPAAPPDSEPIDTSGFGWIDSPPRRVWPRLADESPVANHEAWLVQAQEPEQ